jgi:hypothetical protein
VSNTSNFREAVREAKNHALVGPNVIWRLHANLVGNWHFRHRRISVCRGCNCRLLYSATQLPRRPVFARCFVDVFDLHQLVHFYPATVDCYQRQGLIETLAKKTVARSSRGCLFLLSFGTKIAIVASALRIHKKSIGKNSCT